MQTRNVIIQIQDSSGNWIPTGVVENSPPQIKNALEQAKRLYVTKARAVDSVSGSLIDVLF